MKFSRLSLFFQKIEKNTSRLAITHLLSDLFKQLDAGEFDKTLYLLQGRVAPLYEKIEFGMAERMVIKAICSALNIDKQMFEKTYKKIGDLGAVTEKYKSEIQSFLKKELTIIEVFEKLRVMALASGTGSQEVKVNILAQLVRELDQLSCCFLIRIPLGKMRLGFSDMTILDAFSWMIRGDKSLRPQIEKAYHVRPDIGFIGKALKAKGLAGLGLVKPVLFTPIIMMRAERLSSAAEIIKQIDRCIIEPKYDGFRLQVHYNKPKDEVRLYSRNLEDVSFMYPDVVSGVKKEIKASEIILEGEAIGFDPHAGTFLPFQETVQRKRKYDIDIKAKEIPLKLFVFELLYLNGTDYLTIPFLERRRALEKVTKTTGDIFKDTILIAPEMITDKEKDLEIMFDDAISKGLEGIIAKKLNGIYQPGARGWNWIKYKRSYSSKIEDTIDCLVMGYDFGKGKRTSFGMGAFLVGVYDKKQDKYVTIAKIGTGLTDEEWKQLKIQSSKLKVEKKPALYDVDKMMECDVWISPSTVVEIKADEITRSPVHTASLALRFPRLQRFREDKRPEDVTTLEEVEKMFQMQKK